MNAFIFFAQLAIAILMLIAAASFYWGRNKATNRSNSLRFTEQPVRKITDEERSAISHLFNEALDVDDVYTIEGQFDYVHMEFNNAESTYATIDGYRVNLPINAIPFIQTENNHAEVAWTHDELYILRLNDQYDVVENSKDSQAVSEGLDKLISGERGNIDALGLEVLYTRPATLNEVKAIEGSQIGMRFFFLIPLMVLALVLISTFLGPTATIMALVPCLLMFYFLFFRYPKQAAGTHTIAKVRGRIHGFLTQEHQKDLQLYFKDYEAGERMLSYTVPEAWLEDFTMHFRKEGEPSEPIDFEICVGHDNILSIADGRSVEADAQQTPLYRYAKHVSTALCLGVVLFMLSAVQEGDNPNLGEMGVYYLLNDKPQHHMTTPNQFIHSNLQVGDKLSLNGSRACYIDTDRWSSDLFCERFGFVETPSSLTLSDPNNQRVLSYFAEGGEEKTFPLIHQTAYMMASIQLTMAQKQIAQREDIFKLTNANAQMIAHTIEPVCDLSEHCETLKSELVALWKEKMNITDCKDKECWTAMMTADSKDKRAEYVVRSDIPGYRNALNSFHKDLRKLVYTDLVNTINRVEARWLIEPERRSEALLDAGHYITGLTRSISQRSIDRVLSTYQELQSFELTGRVTDIEELEGQTVIRVDSTLTDDVMEHAAMLWVLYRITLALFIAHLLVIAVRITLNIINKKSSTSGRDTLTVS
ncbi:hypothetical protein ACFOEK_14660 [Litoribrevibacter euphylliae]|uniref:DUF2207 domain-containing protein n=1 Tax=Litoribrevibacter euphylliae TaxID=1834034 RepID=A0ABV7HHR8_9GAMM